MEDNKAVLPTESMITFTLENGCIVTVRSSGTEPKVKFYVELPGEVGKPRDEVESEVSRIAQAVVVRSHCRINSLAMRAHSPITWSGCAQDELLQPSKFKLVRPVDSPIPE